MERIDDGLGALRGVAVAIGIYLVIGAVIVIAWKVAT